MTVCLLAQCVACLFFPARAAHALDPTKRLTQYLHTSWRTQDGSSPAPMFAIAQMADGFLWFSSHSHNIYRFDGIRFLPWPLPSKFRSNAMNLVDDRNGGMWAITGRGVTHIKGELVASEFELSGVLPHSGVSVDADGSLWLVRGRNTVSDAPLCHATDQAVKCFGKADGISISPADALLPDPNGGFWLGGQTALVRWRAGVSETYPIEGLKSNAGNNGIVSLARDPDGTLWVGILGTGPGRGLGQWRNGAFTPFKTPTFDGTTVAVYATIVDHDGNLWVGTNGKGLLRIHAGSVEHYGRGDGLSSDSVQTLFEDGAGIVWAVTTSGIDSFRDPPITTFSASEGLGNDAAIGVLATRDGAVWVANAGSLDRIVSGRVESIRRQNGLPGDQVTSLLEDRVGNLWVGVDNELYVFRDGRFRPVRGPDQQPLGLVVGLTEDVDGNIWAACAGTRRKLVRIRDFQGRESLFEDRVPPGHTLAPNPDGGIWIGTLAGDLVLLRQGVATTFPLHPTGYPVSHQILAGADGLVLAASEDGLVGLRQGTPRRMTTANGLPCTSVTSFIQSRDTRWWLHTDCGIVELDDSELRRWWNNPNAIVRTRLYDMLDGAQPNQPSFNSAALSTDGRVWFATGVVVQMVDPARLPRKAPSASAYIESVVVDRKPFAPRDHLSVSPHPRDLQIDYTSPTFAVPQRVNFRYRLDGYDQDWRDAGTRRQAFYTDLPPGTYSFRVIASNGDGVWSDRAAMLNLSVAPAYYQTNAFRTLVALAAVALVWGAYRWRMRRLRRAFEMALDARVGERTRIAREIHDTLLQSVQALVLRFQTVLNLLPDRPAEAKNRLEAALETADAAIAEGRNAIQGLRDSTVEMNDLALALRMVGEELARDTTTHQAVAFHVTLEGESRNLHPLVRDEIYKIASEALRNAFRHSQARRIDLEIRYDAQQVQVRVRDDGKGLDPAAAAAGGAAGHYGLPGMRERATVIGSRLTVRSAPGEGTEVELRVPGAVAYATSLQQGRLPVTGV
jgi:signal transduction histidine kinase/ligand-binding sensor domain-containing protein